MPLTARQFVTLENQDKIFSIYEQFSGTEMTERQFVRLNSNDQLTEIYRRLNGATLSKNRFSSLPRNEQIAEIYVALGGLASKRKVILEYAPRNQMAAIYRLMPSPTLTFRRFATLSWSMQLAHLYLAVIRLVAGSPINTVAPAVTGTAQDGETLTTTDGTWSTDGNKTRQWQISDDGTTGWTNILGATALTYLQTTGNVDKFIKSKITNTNPSGTVIVDSNAVGPVIAA